MWLVMPPARTGDDPNNLDIGCNPTQTRDVQAIKIRFRSVFCKVLPEWGRYGQQKSIPHRHAEYMRCILYDRYNMRISVSHLSVPHTSMPSAITLFN